MFNHHKFITVISSQSDLIDKCQSTDDHIGKDWQNPPSSSKDCNYSLPLLKQRYVSKETSHSNGLPRKVLDFLYIGSASAAQSELILQRFGITSLVDLCSATVSLTALCQPATLRPRLIVNVDGGNVIDIENCFSDISKHLEVVRRTQNIALVFSKNGYNKAAVVAVHFLMTVDGFSLKGALKYVKEVQPETNIGPNFMAILQNIQSKKSQPENRQAFVRKRMAWM